MGSTAKADRRTQPPGSDGRTLAEDSKTLADSPTAAAAARSPVQVPDHQLLACIGRGSYGEVWLARNVMGTYRAVKIVYRAAFEHARPFEREFNGIQKFEPISRSHDGFVDILQIGRTDDYFYYVMELADDVVTGQQIDPATYEPKTLRSQVQGRKALPFEQCVELGLSLTAALSHLHGHGLIHRDIKPSNIIFVNGIPKLADIGLVAEQSEAKSFVGTEGFIPPEGPGTPQADIYSLGKVLYEIATGKDRHEFPALPTLLGDGGTDTHLLELNAVFVKACQGETQKRYQSAEQVRRDLQLLQSGQSLKRVRRVEEQLAWLKRASTAGIVVTCLVLVGLFFFKHQAAREAVLRQQAVESDRKARQNLYAAQMLLAQRELAGNNYGKARELLERQRPHRLSGRSPNGIEEDMRGWEWRYLWTQCRSDESFTLCTNGGTVRSFAFAPGPPLLAVSANHAVRLWDVEKRWPIKTLEHPQDIPAVTFSSTGKWLATGCDDGIVRLWDEKNYVIDRAITNQEAAESLVFSPDSRILAGGSVNWVRLWDTSTGQQMIEFSSTNFFLFVGMAFLPTRESLPGLSRVTAELGCGTWSIIGTWRLLSAALIPSRFFNSRATAKAW
jgi:hypothetical protein